MKNKFAKLIELGDYQVIVTKQIQKTSDEDYELKVTTQIDGMEASNVYGYDTEEERNDTFEKFDMELAKEFLNAMKTFFKSMT